MILWLNMCLFNSHHVLSHYTTPIWYMSWYLYSLYMASSFMSPLVLLLVHETRHNSFGQTKFSKDTTEQDDNWKTSGRSIRKETTEIQSKPKSWTLLTCCFIWDRTVNKARKTSWQHVRYICYDYRYLVIMMAYLPTIALVRIPIPESRFSV